MSLEDDLKVSADSLREHREFGLSHRLMSHVKPQMVSIESVQVEGGNLSLVCIDSRGGMWIREWTMVDSMWGYHWTEIETPFGEIK